MKLNDTDCPGRCKLLFNPYHPQSNSFFHENKVSIARNLILPQVIEGKQDDITKAIICIFQCCSTSAYSPHFITSLPNPQPRKAKRNSITISVLPLVKKHEKYKKHQNMDQLSSTFPRVSGCTHFSYQLMLFCFSPQ